MHKSLIVLSCLLSSLPAWSDNTPTPRSDLPFEPPPQAYQDCKGKKEGDKVQVSMPDGTKLAMVCNKSAKGLFARPDGPPQGKGGSMEPPAQAYQDCKDKKEGDKITINLPRGDKIPAVCTSSKKGLFARPEQPLGPPGGKHQP